MDCTLPLFPIRPQLKVVRGESRCKQFKDCEGHATGVYFFKDLADCSFGVSLQAR